MAITPTTSFLRDDVKDQTQSLHSLLHQAAISSQVGETLPAAFTILFDLLNTAELAENPLLHAMTHTLLALNIPLYFPCPTDSTSPNHKQRPQTLALKDSAGVYWKSVYLTKAEDILSDIIRERHAHGECKECKQYAEFSDFGINIWNANLKDDGSECNSVVRLEKIMESERLMVNEEIVLEWDRTMREWNREGKSG